MRAIVICVMALALAAVGCGPEVPRDPGGPAADPVALLTVLPTSPGLVDVQAARAADSSGLLRAALGSAPAAMAARVTEAGMERAAVRTWRTPAGGTMAAAVAVWPTRPIAANFALQITQQRLDDAGVSAWTPEDVPGAQGTRQAGGIHERLLARSVGPNALLLRATGDVPDAVIAKAMERLVRVQEARG